MDLEQLIKESKEPEVTKAVFTELKTIGDNSKKGYDELRKTYEELKKTMEEGKGKLSADSEARLSKLQEDLTIRQTHLDEVNQKNTAMQKQIDDIIVAMKRPGQSAVTPEDVKKDLESRIMMVKSIMACKGQGLDFQEEKLDDVMSQDSFSSYRKGFQNYLRKGKDNFTDTEKKSMMFGSDPDGGYVVTPQMSNMIITRLYEIDPIRALASVETISTQALEWLVDFDETDAEWEGETVAVADDTKTAKLFKKKIEVNSLASKPTATQVLLEDAAVNIEAWLSRKAADKFSRKEAAAFVSGNGVGKPRGFLTYGDYTTAGTDEYGKIEQIHMGNASALTADGFISVKYSLIEQYLNRGTWLMNRATVAAAMKLKDGQGDYIWKPGLQSDQNASILGLPVRMSTSMPAVAASALAVALADWKEAYMIVDRLGITVLRDPYTKKPFVLFYFRKRTGGDVINYQAIKIGTVEA